MEDVLKNHLCELETRLLQPEFRRQRDEVAQLLADDFREFGSSGRVFNKQQILDALENENDQIQRVISQFEIQVLAEGVVLATYEVARVNEEKRSLRSSVWELREGRWQMVFHQGTSIKSY